ncbi:hypothetical protein BH11ARM2_BH11ARM2_28700 [soil metagenome]
MNLKTAFATLGLLGLAAFSSAQVTKVGSAYQFRLKLAAGTSYKYSMNIIQKGTTTPGGGIAVKVPFSQKVVSITGDTATITYSAGPIMLNGQPLSPKPSVGTAKMSRQGKVVGGSMAAGQGVAVFPATPVMPGSSWSSDVPLGGMGASGGSTAKATYRFVGVKNVGGKQVAELAVTVVGTGQTKVNGSGTTYVLLTDGAPWKSNLTIKISGIQAQGTTAPAMTMQMAITRV